MANPKADAQAVEDIKEIAGLFGLALYTTIRRAILASRNPGASAQGREKDMDAIEEAWQEVVEKIVEFAEHD